MSYDALHRYHRLTYVSREDYLRDVSRSRPSTTGLSCPGCRSRRIILFKVDTFPETYGQCRECGFPWDYADQDGDPYPAIEFEDYEEDLR